MSETQKTKTNQTNQIETLRELMNRYNEKRAAWVELNGHSDGFDTWFTNQVS